MSKQPFRVTLLLWLVLTLTTWNFIRFWTALEWREVFQDLSHHGVYHSGEVVGLGNLVCEKCHYHLPVYTPDVLPRCPKCGHDQFQRRPFEP